MKRIYFLFLFSFLFCNGLFAQSCLPNGITFTTQEEIDDFAVNYPGCTEITGNIFIEGWDILNLDGLNQITSIGGNLAVIDGWDLTSLQGLQNITSIGGNLIISQCYYLTSLQGLQNITSIGGSLEIREAHALTSLQGLQNITSIGGSLEIREAYALTSLQGLQNITSIGANLTIYDLDITSLQGLENITNIPGSLEISFCLNLSSLQGLQNITSIGGSLTISYLSITNLQELENITTIPGSLIISSLYTSSSLQGLQNITSIGGGLTISSLDITSLQELENITTIPGSLEISSCSQLSSLQDLQNMTSLGGNLKIRNNDGLSNLQGLENIISFPNNVEISSCDGLTSLEGFSNQSSIAGDLTIQYNNSLSNLQGLENITSIGGEFKVANNDNLINLSGLDNLNTVSGLLDISNNDALISLSGLDNLNAVNSWVFIVNNDALTSVTSLNGLTSIYGRLRVGDNGSLASLAGLNNITAVISKLEIYDNPNLSVCGLSNFCAYLTNGGAFSIYGNAPNCNDDLEILNNCIDLTKIQAITYYDLNQNKVKDSGEPNYTDDAILIEPGSLAIYPNTQNGSIFFLEPGNYTVSYNLSDPNWALTTDSASYFLSLGANEADTIYFGVFPVQQISNQISFVNSPPARCNENVAFEVTTKNLGTTTTSGTLWFEMDNNVTSFYFADAPDTLIAPNIYGWFFTDLFPGQTITKQVNMIIPGPPGFPVGGFLNFDTYVTYTDVNGLHNSKLFNYHTLVECSFDPNDKLIYPERTNEGFMQNYTLFDESLFYTIRFQNTGNAVAYDVVIKDTLDANLDWTSFQFLGSSHADVLTTTMDENGILEFDFTDIFLPDSTSNFDGSQGYVSYLIKPNAGLAENTVIENSAGIYFDLNPPVITNTTENIMISDLCLVNPFPPTMSVNGLPIPDGTYQADYQINSTGRVRNGSEVHFKAGQIILLDNGFSVDLNAGFSAEIDDCGTVN